MCYNYIKTPIPQTIKSCLYQSNNVLLNRPSLGWLALGLESLATGLRGLFYYPVKERLQEMIEKLEHIKALNEMPEEEWRFWAKVDTDGPTMPHMDTPCWIWKAAKTPLGYGLFNFQGKLSPAHRCSWFFTYGEVLPTITVMMHKCDNPSCVNPDHLTPGTHFENQIDMARKGRAATSFEPKLSYEIAVEIREKYKSGNITQTALAQEYGISNRSIQKILGNHTYQSP